MGKTNLLDAIYYLALGKSHFRIPDQQLAQHGADFFRMEARYELKGKDCSIIAKIEPGKQKTFEKDGKKYKRLSDHVGLIPLVMIAPDDTIIGTGGSEERRRVMDETLCQVDNRYLQELMTYNRVLKQRNAALKLMAKKNSWDVHLVQSFDAQLIAPATYIFETRQKWMQPINAYFLAHFKDITNDAEVASIEYKSGLSGESFEDMLLQAREKDRILQRTTVGIHKDDLVFKVKDYPLKKIASQGQLKSFILALRLAQYAWLSEQTKQQPILLLDDIFDKLDGLRVGHLIALLSGEEFGQVFISDTSIQRLPSIFKQSKVVNRVFEVEDGVIKEIS